MPTALAAPDATAFADPIVLLSRRALLCAGVSPLWRAARAAGTPQAQPAPPPPLRPMLATPWQDGANPADYLVSEKLDGVRALWDGQVLRFRSGRPIAAPAWFLQGLPPLALDGELWLGRQRFEALSGTVRKQVPVDDDWRALRYMVFDLPQDTAPFAQRAARLQEAVAATRHPWLQAVLQSRVADATALQVRLRAVVAAGGEGLVLHRADALWAPGRSDALRKLKPLPDDEGTVLEVLPGKGKNRGRMGALRLQLPDGQSFHLGTGFSDAQRNNPPPVGAIVTFRYRDRTAKGLPRFASFLRVRDAE